MEEAADAIEALQTEALNMSIHADYCESLAEAYKSEVENMRQERCALLSKVEGDCRYCFYEEVPLEESPCCACFQFGDGVSATGDFWRWLYDNEDGRNNE